MKLKILVILQLISSLCIGSEKPNIIFILVDDMGWSDIGCYGSEIKTPHIDKLANEGLRLTQMHNTSKCFPSRACLLTGVYAQQCGMSKGFEKITQIGRRTLADPDNTNFTGLRTAITRGAILFKSSRTQCSKTATSMTLLRFATPMVSAKFLIELGV